MACTYIDRFGVPRPSKRGANCPKRGGGGLHVGEPKSHAGRRVLTLPPSVLTELKVHRRAQVAERLASEVRDLGPRGGWVFANPTGGPLDPRGDARAFKLLCAKADAPARRLHDLSHSAATMMLENELDLRTAGAVLGHSQVSQTARYSHVLADRKAVVAERIEHAPFGTRATALEKYCSRDAELRASHCPAGTRTSAHVSRIVVKTVVSPGSGLPQILPRGPEQVVPAPPRGLEPLTRRLEGGRSIL